MVIKPVVFALDELKVSSLHIYNEFGKFFSYDPQLLAEGVEWISDHLHTPSSKIVKDLHLALRISYKLINPLITERRDSTKFVLSRDMILSENSKY